MRAHNVSVRLGCWMCDAHLVELWIGINAKCFYFCDCVCVGNDFHFTQNKWETSNMWWKASQSNCFPQNANDKGPEPFRFVPHSTCCSAILFSYRLVAWLAGWWLRMSAPNVSMLCVSSVGWCASNCFLSRHLSVFSLRNTHIFLFAYTKAFDAIHTHTHKHAHTSAHNVNEHWILLPCASMYIAHSDSIRL